MLLTDIMLVQTLTPPIPSPISPLFIHYDEVTAAFTRVYYDGGVQIHLSGN